MYQIFLDLIEQNQEFIRIAGSILLFLVFWIFKGPVVNVSIRAIDKALNRKKELVNKENLVFIFAPIKSLLALVGLYLAFANMGWSKPFLPLFRISWIVAITWMFLRFADRASGVLFRFNSSLDESLDINLNQTLLHFLQKLLKVIILCISGVAILGETGVNVTTIITGIGLGGLTFALAAQDTASNLFGGLVILLDKPFDIGDWIATPSIEGVVEDITFRSTRIRTFSDSLVVVPNNSLTSSSITNWSRMEKRQASFSVGVTYNTPADKMHTCIDKITQLLKTSDDIDQQTIVVNFNSFQDSSLEIAVYFFTKTTSFAEYRKVLEKVNFGILSIMEEVGVEFAFPTQTLYVEKTQNELVAK